MTDQDKPRFAELLGALAEVSRQAVSPALAALYFRVLGDLSLAAVEAGIANVMRTHRLSTLPMPAEIRESITGSADDRAILAWGDVRRAMFNVGRYSDPRGVLDAATYDALIVAFGSWPAACDQPIEGAESGWAVKRFQAAYAALARRDATGDVSALTRGEAQRALADVTARCGVVPFRRMDS